MERNLADKATVVRKLLCGATGLAGCSALVFLSCLVPLRAQSAANWEEAAGGKMSFEVASVKRNIASGKTSLPFPLDGGDGFRSTGGLFSVEDLPLWAYISFAYKLSFYQVQTLRSKAPKWVVSENFDVDARAPEGENPTKDQYRLMVQSLLAERFKLAAHFLPQQMPVFALNLVKRGRTGPQLRPHSNDPPCAESPILGPTTSVEPASGGLPVVCGALGARPVAGHESAGGRNMTMAQIADTLPLLSMGTLDRPVVDRTGLSGRFDFTLNWTPTMRTSSAAVGTPSTPPEDAPSFLEALRDELGVKLNATNGSVDVLILDHIEELSPN